jgi:hypothetical protein
VAGWRATGRFRTHAHFSGILRAPCNLFLPLASRAMRIGGTTGHIRSATQRAALRVPGSDVVTRRMTAFQ